MIFTLSFVNKGKENKPPVSLLEHIFMGQHIFWINTENACKRGYLFWCILIYRGKREDFLGRSVLWDWRTLSLFHSMFSCNFATLAILDVCVCNMCATRAIEKSPRFVRWVRPCVIRTWLVLTAFYNTPITPSSPTCFISRLLNPWVWP